MRAYRVTITAIIVEDGDGDPGNWDVGALLVKIKKNLASHDPEVESVELRPKLDPQSVLCSNCRSAKVIS